MAKPVYTQRANPFKHAKLYSLLSRDAEAEASLHTIEKVSHIVLRKVSIVLCSPFAKFQQGNLDSLIIKPLHSFGCLLANHFLYDNGL